MKRMNRDTWASIVRNSVKARLAKERRQERAMQKAIAKGDELVANLRRNQAR